MGLDMYIESVEKGTDITASTVEKEEIYYWRKFNALHGWMENLYYERNPQSTEMFNCIFLKLEEDDLDRLEQDVKDGKLKPVEGFFFGSQEIYPEQIESVYEMIEKSGEELDAGRDVYYFSWW